MSEAMRMWVEISFNITYLVVIWCLVLVMVGRRGQVAQGDRRAANLVIWAFALLALGDTGHVGFRVMAYALGGLEVRPNIFGFSVGLVGLGALSTAVTVTMFYVLMLELWRERFKGKYGWFAYSMILAAGIRLVLMALPVNDWNAVTPPQPWSIIRNIPLVYQGLGVAVLILRDAGRKHDLTFRWVGISILVSYACYAPVILFVQQIPVIGMLMIPKTLAYVAVGFLAYTNLYSQSKRLEARGSV